MYIVKKQTMSQDTSSNLNGNSLFDFSYEFCVITNEASTNKHKDFRKTSTRHRNDGTS